MTSQPWIMLLAAQSVVATAQTAVAAAAPLVLGTAAATAAVAAVTAGSAALTALIVAVDTAIGDIVSRAPTGDIIGSLSDFNDAVAYAGVQAAMLQAAGYVGRIGVNLADAST